MSHLDRRTVLASASVLALLGADGHALAKAHSKGGGRTLGRQDAQTSILHSDAYLSSLPGRRVSFDAGWKFAFGHLSDIDKDFGFGADLRTFAKQGPDATPLSLASFDDSHWRDVSLPHDWAVELPFVENPKAATYKPDDHGAIWDPAANHGFKPLGRDYPETSIGWYRKTLQLSGKDAGARISLEFDGVFRACLVIVNGYIVQSHDGGYGPFRVELNDFLNTDNTPNTLLVRVDASLGEGWFYEGAGIYRHVWLVKTHPVHIPQYGLHVTPHSDGRVDVITTVRNDSDQAVQINLNLSQVAERGSSPPDALAKSVTTPHRIEPWQTIEVVSTLKIAAPKLWSLEAPNLYGVMATVGYEDIDFDSLGTSFGFRDIRFDADQGVFLNGQPLKLKGTCNHQDHAGLGSALPDAIQRYRLQCLKDMGCNAYRTSHNPPTPELLELCDEMGILVIDETRLMTSSPEGLEQLSTMIRRDRNHPSVMLWSIGNEEPQQGTDRGAKIARTMKRRVKELDPTRPITAAMDNGYGLGITSVLDVIGFNYRDQLIDDFHKNHPNLPIIGTETASTVSTRGEYVQDDKAQVVPAYDTTAPWWATTAEGWWPHFNSRPFIGGGFIWTGFDYRGEPTPYSTWPSISSQFGALDTCGFPKDNYYYYRAWWRPEPLLHLFPHWNWEGKEGQSIPVWAYCNADEVELFVNGVSAGRKAMVKDRHVEWSVVYQPGKIEAFAYKNGKVILKDVRETAGPAASLKLTADRLDLSGDGQDCAVVKVEVLDANGRTVPKADNLVTFTVQGPAQIIGVGNGNPNSHDADKASKRHAFNGLCCAIVQTRAAGLVTLSASAEGLAPGKITLKVAAAT